jgi:hypothetical protein
VFEITPTGKLTTLYQFCSQTNCTDGAYPIAGLLQASNGYFYGTTTYGVALEIRPVSTLATPTPKRNASVRPATKLTKEF